ncbi:hypothetical protein C440_05340 [Haloferax mucosum ATCC BAA-1512]|uniref:Uncharacterized protein n=1 Tax=Haloferax mucosum ATCC BAA-1512 TaxID=662479 RepID=M0IJ84_9EURY|nr:hypothetical protein [Haloferax mucosum]ELZ96087.1 hypothetical protein C440_05340 [Haloferax mucosum ATCC BAA-1512]
MTDFKKRLSDLEDRVSSLEGQIAGQAQPASKSEIRSFVEDWDPDTHKERAVVIGYFIEHGRGENNFTVEDITDGYRECKIQEPANMSDILAGAEKEGLAMRDGKEGRLQNWVLTADGEKFVTEGNDE